MSKKLWMCANDDLDLYREPAFPCEEMQGDFIFDKKSDDRDIIIKFRNCMPSEINMDGNYTGNDFKNEVRIEKRDDDGNVEIYKQYDPKECSIEVNITRKVLNTICEEWLRHVKYEEEKCKHKVQERNISDHMINAWTKFNNE